MGVHAIEGVREEEEKRRRRKKPLNLFFPLAKP